MTEAIGHCIYCGKNKCPKQSIYRSSLPPIGKFKIDRNIGPLSHCRPHAYKLADEPKQIPIRSSNGKLHRGTAIVYQGKYEPGAVKSRDHWQPVSAEYVSLQYRVPSTGTEHYKRLRVCHTRWRTMVQTHYLVDRSLEQHDKVQRPSNIPPAYTNLPTTTRVVANQCTVENPDIIYHRCSTQNSWTARSTTQSNATQPTN